LRSQTTSHLVAGDDPVVANARHRRLDLRRDAGRDPTTARRTDPMITSLLIVGACGFLAARV
jgi:hypothetical protein